jgi:succinate dehydrogenase cytochrome b556 subunit
MIQSEPAIKPPAAAVQPFRGILRDVAKPLKHLARNRGWPYLIAWCHRISGVLLVVYMVLHILTLSALHRPERFAVLIQFYGFFLLRVLEWMLAIPVIFHAFNGGRLILYEVFGNRRDDLVIRWVTSLTGGYVLLLAVVMIMGDQTVSAAFFWLYTVAAASCVAGITLSGVRLSGAGVFWKLQRITGAYLLLMVPAHMLFMHLNPSLGHDARVIVERMHSGFIRLIDLTLVLCVLYHGAYGFLTIGRDYLSPGRTRTAAGVLVVAVLTALAWIGVKLTVMG